jgi:hypothetical protein
MISLQELNPKNFPLTRDMELNIQILLARINVVREAWGKPMTVTSGVRSVADQKRVYAEIARRNNSNVIRVPMGSKHLSAQAVDIADPDGSLMLWCKANVPLLERTGLWIEADTKGWTHFQTVAPGSGNRFFKP